MTTENNQMDISQEEEVPLVEAAAPEGETGVDPILGRGEIETTHHEGGRGEEEEEEEESLEDYAEMVVTILQPVAITMLLVVWMVRLMNASNIVIVASQAIYQVYTEEDDDGTATKLFGSILNALIFLAIIIAVTVLFVILYKYRCLKIIYAWLITSTGMLLAVFGGYLFSIVLEATNVALDWISYSFILWNFSIVGIMSIFWHAPQKVTQGYLIVISGLMAVWFTRLPEWTTWAILGVVAIYDLFAVLCPRGPLKVLVETAQERQEPIPALLYNASAFIMMAEPGDRQNSSRSHTILDEDEENDNNNENDNENTENRNNNSSIIINNNNNNNNEAANPNAPQEQEERGKGVKLGLGDFVFYSVLMGRAALFDMITVFTCFVAIITGLFATLLLLAIFRKALPALPISIALGIIFYFLTSAILWPFALTIGKAQIFV